ncbi:M12 family metallopeptidase [Asticcacaulis sp. SL142]|uniref:M12 family metallopeptidase n=1 Tax=Asticcacaulis sp. SL142 TaxID=2995155 RepID=UPI00226D1A41|nr:M12 family metallopeptidase [Asticcacaulis sp. SL142]WAC49747.1 M12 family metallopeptidase [Asticcacaulis sp. SL142]
MNSVSIFMLTLASHCCSAMEVFVHRIYYSVMLAVVTALCLFGTTTNAGAVLQGTKSWPYGEVPYHISASLRVSGASNNGCHGWHTWPQTSEAYHVCRAMDAWHRATGVRFTYEPVIKPDTLIISQGQATTAYLGYRDQLNRLNIKKSENYGPILHEIGHILGLAHEHQRFSRNEYITVSEVVNETITSCDGNPRCRNVSVSMSQLPDMEIVSTDYDLCSVMHYAPDQSSLALTDAKWQTMFTLTRSGKDALKKCAGQFSHLGSGCMKVGQNCSISLSDANVARRFNLGQ